MSDRSDESLRRYREASATLDERPSDATRAAILAAAAGNADAKPRVAGASRSTLRRWPLAAAATVLLSSLAVILASRTEEETPKRTVQEQQAAPPVAGAPFAAPKDNAAAGLAARSAAPAASAPAPESTAPASGPTLPEAPSTAAKSRRPSARDGAAQATSEAASRSPHSDGSDRAQSPEQGLRRIEPASPPGADARQEATSKPAQRSAQDWLERIVRLRAEGRHAEADAELKRFRESYPERAIPPAARGPAGAR